MTSPVTTAADISPEAVERYIQDPGAVTPRGVSPTSHGYDMLRALRSALTASEKRVAELEAELHFLTIERDVNKARADGWKEKAMEKDND